MDTMDDCGSSGEGSIPSGCTTLRFEFQNSEVVNKKGGVPGVVYRPAFEKLGRRKPHGGSNPSSSAKLIQKLWIQK
jgi:hypothetical protein